MRLLPVSDPESPEFQRFLREAHILSSLSHPGIVRLFELSMAEDGRPFMVLEPLRGELLATRLAQGGRLRARDTRRFLTTLSSILWVAHRAGVVHRDIVPDNIVLTPETEHELKLLGFRRGGTGKDSVTRGAAKLERHRSPEEMRAGPVDPRTDVYQLGVLGWEMVTNLPFLELGEVKDPAELLRRITEQVPPSPRDVGARVSRGMADVLLKMVEKDPQERYQSAQEVAEALAELDGTESMLGTPPTPPSEDWGFSPGTLVGRSYRVQGVLGEGGMGTVLLARDEQLDRPVAIKVVRTERLASGDVAHLRVEAQAMARVRHENVVGVYAFGQHDGFPYLVMEHVPGESAQQMLDRARGGLPIADVLSILEQTASGLTAIHTRGLLHGDVKPANVLIGPGFHVGLTDFGLTAPLSADGSQTQSTRLRGTPAYTAPELIRGRVNAELLHRVDIYALGVTAFELLTGRLPFLAADPNAMFVSHLEEEPPPPSTYRTDVPRALDALVLECLAKDPRERVPTARELIARLRHTTRTLPPPPPAVERRVLIADDDEDFRDLATLYIEELCPGAHIDRVPTGRAAVAAASRGRYDLLLVDLDMPDMNGVEVVASLRAELAEVPPVLVVSASGGASDWQVLAALGAKGFLVKPLMLESLALHVQRLLSG